MDTFNFILKLIISVVFTYVAFNSIFHYHFTIKRITFIFIVFGLLTVISFLGSSEITYFLITEALLLIFYLLGVLLLRKRGIHGYFMFNSYTKAAYENNKDKLERSLKKYGIPYDNLCYTENRPFLFVLKNVDSKTAKLVAKKMDAFSQKEPKSFNMASYWHIVALLIIFVIVWRF